MLALAGAATLLAMSLQAKTKRVDTVGSATKPGEFPGNPDADVLIICASFHHFNTLKIANAIALVLNVQMMRPEQLVTADLTKYKLIGFGSGIYSQTFHSSILDCVDKLTNPGNSKAFLFSTSGVSRAFALKSKSEDFHTPLRTKLSDKGFEILDEYNCKGWNTNRFLKVFGGLNKGKPDEDDLKNAREFAAGLNERI